MFMFPQESPRSRAQASPRGEASPRAQSSPRAPAQSSPGGPREGDPEAGTGLQQQASPPGSRSAPVAKQAASPRVLSHSERAILPPAAPQGHQPATRNNNARAASQGPPVGVPPLVFKPEAVQADRPVNKVVTRDTFVEVPVDRTVDRVVRVEVVKEVIKEVAVIKYVEVRSNQRPACKCRGSLACPRPLHASAFAIAGEQCHYYANTMLLLR